MNLYLGDIFEELILFIVLGVNRPLRTKEENPYDNLNCTFYRDQISKVALAISDIIGSMKESVTFQFNNKKIEKASFIVEKRDVTGYEPAPGDKIKVTDHSLQN